MKIILLLGLPGGLEFIILALFFLFPAILWIWALIDLIKSDFRESNLKLIWALIIIFIPLLGSILYLFIGRNQKIPRTNM